jgi:hypothetical protein
MIDKEKMERELARMLGCFQWEGGWFKAIGKTTCIRVNDMVRLAFATFMGAKSES